MYLIFNGLYQKYVKKPGITFVWSKLVRIMNTQKIVSTRMDGLNGKIIQIREC
jgi:hypothetical protein